MRRIDQPLPSVLLEADLCLDQGALPAAERRRTESRRVAADLLSAAIHRAPPTVPHLSPSPYSTAGCPEVLPARHARRISFPTNHLRDRTKETQGRNGMSWQTSIEDRFLRGSSPRLPSEPSFVHRADPAAGSGPCTFLRIPSTAISSHSGSSLICEYTSASSFRSTGSPKYVPN